MSRRYRGVRNLQAGPRREDLQSNAGVEGLFIDCIVRYDFWMHRRWILPPAVDRLAVVRLAGELGIPAFVAECLVRRDLSHPGHADDFLNPRLRALSDPNDIPGISLAVARIGEALRRRERIVLFGDYDVDGVASVAILYRVFSAFGGNVECFLPHRADEGYGLSAAGLERCLAGGRPGLLVAVDCGTTAVAEIARLQEDGIDVIVLDHHEPSTALPRCTALVNPKVAGAEFSYLCSAGIAFKTAHALLKANPLPDFQLREILDLVALATLCDLVPILAENRILVRHGLRQMEVSRWPGLTALMRSAGVNPPLTGAAVGFRLGPRINAAGRLGTASDALRLLLADDDAEAAELAAVLDRSNKQRQAIERSVTEEVEAWIAENFDPIRDTAIVAGARDWHTGVLGIVASRVMRHYNRPALIVGFDASGSGRGSGRSIEGFSLVNALSRCSAWLDQYGGHDMAAGVTLQEDQFGDFRMAFNEAAQALTDSEMLVPRLHLDAEMTLDQFDHGFLEAQALLEPFGNANSQPVLFARQIAPLTPPRFIKEKHIRLTLPAGRSRIDCIFFNGAARPLPPPPWDIAFHLERNDFQGRVSPQLHILDVRAAA